MKSFIPLWILLHMSPLLGAAGAAAQSEREVGADAGLRVASREVRYEVEAERLGEVVELLNEMRLEGESGPLSQGLTDYRLTPRWKFDVRGERCGLSSVSVDVDIAITLPRWSGADHANAGERRRWKEILARITRHEYRHREITVEVATELLERLEGLKAETCTGVRQAAQGAVALAEAALHERHASFDAVDGRGS